MKAQTMLGVALLVVAGSAPFWLIQTGFVLTLFIQTFIFMAAAIAWNVISGFGGQLSFGHSVFFGLGGYTSTLLFIHFNVTPWIGLLAAGLVASLAAVVIGLPSFRLQGIYFTLVTFAFTLILVILAGHFDGLTGGHVGLSVPFQRGDVSAMQFENRVWFYYLGLMLVIATFTVSVMVIRSRLGYWLRAIRDDQVAAEACGVNVRRAKLTALVISAFLTSMAGVIYAQYTLFIDPETGFGLATASLIALPAIAGGLGTLWGPVVGALLLIPLEQFIDDSFDQAPAGFSLVVYAAIIIVVVLLDRGGIVSLVNRLRGFVGRARGGGGTDQLATDELTSEEVSR